MPAVEVNINNFEGIHDSDKAVGAKTKAQILAMLEI